MKLRTALGFLIIAIGLAALAVSMNYLIQVNRRLAEIPQPIYQPFSSWSGPFTTPPLAAGDYEIAIDYLTREPGRLLENLKFTLFDETAKKAIPTDAVWLSAQFGSGDHQGPIFCEFHATDGHRYTIDIDPTQVAELARYRHPRLLICLTAREINNRIGQALRLNGNEDTPNE